MIDNFKVSVITPVYNAAPYIRKAVESAINLDDVGEVILIEDCSTDNSLEICKQLELEHPKVKLIQHPDNNNHGAGASRNFGIKKSDYNYIAFLDADDYYLPNRFEVEKKLFADDQGIDGVYGALGIHYYNAESQRQFQLEFSNQTFLTLSAPVDYNDLIYVFLNEKYGITGSFHTDCITLKKSVFTTVGLFNEQLRLQQDVDLWLRIAAKCRLVAGQLNAPVAMRGVHENQRMTNVENQKKYAIMRWKFQKKWFKENITDQKLLKTFNRKYYEFITSNCPKRQARRAWFWYLCTHPCLICEKNGFFDLRLLELFGRNWITLHLVSFKNRFIK